MNWIFAIFTIIVAKETQRRNEPMRIIFMLTAMLAFALPAQASLFDSVDDRGDKITDQLQGNNSYHAHLAREFAMIASSEKSQHDLGVAKCFIKMAEEEAAKAGDAK
ncbi:MAG: hypothetical protein Q9M31_00135 [Mariprofundus sp.]|nr:hypothetical protein [Mariprofundus sp.]